MAELNKRERNRLRKLRSLPPMQRAIAETREMIRLARAEKPFNAMPKSPRPTTRPGGSDA